MRGRPYGYVSTGSLVYQLGALLKVPAVVILCGPRGHSAIMKTITGHFLRAPSLRGTKYRQRALYCVQPDRGALLAAVLVERMP